MIRRAIIAGLLATVAPAAVAAEPNDGSVLRAMPQKKGEAASQIRVFGYSPTKRTEITGAIGQPTTLTFPSGESVYRVVQTSAPDGNGGLTDAGWQGPRPEEVKETPLGNVLTLWPAKPGHTTMTVITKEPDGTQKVYPFRLNAVSDIADQTVTLNVIFKGGAHPGGGEAAANRVAALSSTGDPLPARKPRAATNRRRSQPDDEAAAERIRADAFNRAGGCHYTAKGPTGPIEPRCPLDNQQWTLLRFPGLTQKPAVYVSDPAYLCGADNGAHERLARQHGAGDFVVVEEIAQRFCVRLGSSVLQIDNTAFNPAGAPTGTGTIAPSVRRDLIKAAKK